MSHSDKNLTRRRFVEATGVAAAVGLAGCDGGGGGDGTPTPSDGTPAPGNGTPTPSDGTPTVTDEPLEVMHGWTGGDGATAAEALVSAFEEEHPDMATEFNPIGGGGNQNLDTVVANRLQNDDPPAAFANWPGPNLQRYQGALGDVDDVWEENGFEDAHIDEAIDLHRTDGTFRAVPLGSHRLNNLFYNVAIVEEAGVDPSGIDSIDAFIDALDAVQSETDATPFTHATGGGVWTTNQLWCAVMLGKEGYQPYMDFIEGNGDESAVRSAFETLAEILENYIPDDSASLDLTANNGNIIDGNAAFTHNGNWAAGAFRNSDGFEYEDDWGANAFPGTEGMYTLHFDSFLYPSSNPAPQKARTWLTFVGSESAQVAFNQYKGSIPTRTDVDMNEFGPYLQEAAEDFSNADQRPPTLGHGLAVDSETMTQLEEVLSNSFSGPYDVDAATSGFMDAV